MPNQEEKMKELIQNKTKEMLLILESTMTKETFLNSFKRVIEHAKKVEKELRANMDIKTQQANDDLASLVKQMQELKEIYLKSVERVDAETEKIKEDNKSTLSNVKRWAFQRVGDLVIKNKVNESLQSLVAEMEGKISELNEYEPPEVSEIVQESTKLATEGLLPLIPVIDKLEEELPKYGEAVRDALELLQDDERLDITAIKGLEELLEEIKQTKVLGGAGGSGAGKFNTSKHNLSGSLDGSTRTFNLPAFREVISVHLSSLPLMIEDEDFTVDGSAGTITFTSEVSDLDLGANQRCLIIYSEI